MYWPFFRSKQEEMIALKELGPYLGSNLVVPVIKPHDAASRVEGQISRVLQTGLRAALIVNTNEGSPVPAVADVMAMENSLENAYPNQVFPTLEVHPGVTAADVSGFLNTYSGRTQVFVHRAHTLSAAIFPASDAIHIFESNGVSPQFVSCFSASRCVILRDGFKKQSVNGGYPSVSYFDDLAYSYRIHGYDGFGDFAAIGDVPYNTGGGQPSHVALHLTEPHQNNTFHCRHFVSAVPPATTDVQTKYFDALAQLIGHTGSPGVGPFSTFGVSDYCNNYVAGNFPGLGSPKRWSTKHHIQLLHSVLDVSSAAPWV
ncbi:sce7725 family protein [Chromohalobacter canadensis]|uniref:Sce7725 family protein n=1 Tax=Chromohalobacter canadensis TaxID=141389 RepID=A0ABZ0Y7J2_9GAMM|nr:sce7725 family protein [Chromohalobacter canadensis]MCK0768824.1 sce7725 family protein [Chromohalobacter canadensis]WQH08026.1 sce7725 family protein [Chromohalobacter canadensis]